MSRNRIIARTIAVVALLAWAAPAAAQEWPTRPVTLVVPYAAGSTSDVLGRVLATRLSELLGQQVIVENVGGAGGAIGVARVAKATPDGSQFVLGTIATHAFNPTVYQKPLYDAVADFEPVALMFEAPYVLVARKGLPVADLAEFRAYAQAKQNKMQFGSTGMGAGSHLFCVLLNAAIGITVTHVPYRGDAPAMQDLIAGRTDYQCALAAVAIPQIEGGQIKALAMLTRERSPVLPALASAHQQGLTDFEATAWNAIFLPKGTPDAIVRKLSAAAAATLETPNVQARLEELGATVVARERRSPQYLQKFVVREIDKWAAPIKAAGVSAP
jgi:tripartite-type tricarboxylate transporter receptor subunit TctC